MNIKIVENEYLGVQMISLIMKREEKEIVVVFVDNTDFITNSNNSTQKIRRILNRYT